MFLWFISLSCEYLDKTASKSRNIDEKLIGNSLEGSDQGATPEFSS
jgi:hypothetical protein